MNDTSLVLHKSAVPAKIETASTAAAAAAKAEIEAAHTVALHRPRNIDQARADILAACKRPRFAEAAIYRKPVGREKAPDGTWRQKVVEDLSIRAAEECMRAMRNIRITSTTVYEDDEIRKKAVTITDLESVLSYGREITLHKTVERRGTWNRDAKQHEPPRGRRILGTRTNTQGETVYIVEATEDELAIKEAALASKLIRTEGLRLVPSDIKEEAREQCYKTMSDADAQDPDAARKRLMDAFGEIGVTPAQLAGYIGHDIKHLQPAELADLRQVYRAIKDGEAKWADYGTPSASDEPDPIADPKRKPRKASKLKANKPEPEPETPEATTAPENLQLAVDAVVSNASRGLLSRSLDAVGLEGAGDLVGADEDVLRAFLKAAQEN